MPSEFTPMSNEKARTTFRDFIFTSECNETSLAVDSDMQIFTRSLARWAVNINVEY